ncbi:response regulator [Spirosoma endbachense]|uniref:Response regulator n=1 Tax=Spirosoma endbachense TaxID=2666025 RepID=A0A6P1VTE9_9BACT|nr:response regulator [Spirosoma endbachense]QHV95965.1 response regulator [Spirosoma endbachense]
MTTIPVKPVSILIVEDEAILALELCVKLEAEGYNIAGTATTGRQALALHKEQTADIVICDINLRGDWTGIETARQLSALNPIPIIYLSALTDRATLEQAKLTKPAAYLTKPVTTDSLRIAIEIALSNFAYVTASNAPVIHEPMSMPMAAREGETILQVGDYIFIKQNYQFVRLHKGEVLYIEAEDKYTTVVTPTRKFVLRLSLAVLLQRLADMTLIRVHRSFAVNLSHVESFSDYEVQVPGQTVPLGRVYKEEFLHHFRFR